MLLIICKSVSAASAKYSGLCQHALTIQQIQRQEQENSEKAFDNGHSQPNLQNTRKRVHVDIVHQKMHDDNGLVDNIIQFRCKY